MKESECPPEYRNPRNPYLRSLVRQGRLCPSCAHPMWFKVSYGSADFGWWRCDACGRIDPEMAPEGMRVGGTQTDGPVRRVDHGRDDGGEAKVLQFRPRGGRR
ncbi:hypothetical protein [Parafannyhessea umbonata]|uniref:hypothetical protein n=1 Tax=Parafannyhessea umbonata TaxID=604330 RepID=UPI00359CAB49